VNETTIQLSGNVATDVRHRETDTGLHIASFRLATTPTRFDSAQRAWVDQPTSYYSVTCFRYLAQNVAESLQKGEPVVVTGTLRIAEWEKDGRSGKDAEIVATSVGHDLNRGIAGFRRVTRSRLVAPAVDAAARLAPPPLPTQAGPGRELVDVRTGELLGDGEVDGFTAELDDDIEDERDAA
jgi:single-strand DNA-binding protein